MGTLRCFSELLLWRSSDCSSWVLFRECRDRLLLLKSPKNLTQRSEKTPATIDLLEDVGVAPEYLGRGRVLGVGVRAEDAVGQGLTGRVQGHRGLTPGQQGRPGVDAQVLAGHLDSGGLEGAEQGAENRALQQHS